MSPKKRSPKKSNYPMENSPSKTVKMRKTQKNFKRDGDKLMNTMNGSFNISQDSIMKVTNYGYKNYALGTKYHIVKTTTNRSCDYKGNFEVVPNVPSNDTGEHIQTIEFDKSPDRHLERSNNFNSSMNRRKKFVHNMRLKMSKYSNFKGGLTSLLSTQTEMPAIMKKHVPTVKIGKLTSREELW
mmetsp:Transcript_28506/g.25235  ORF Transcript_28506/g.25235 Transcript_28506/m.25235 type:complete len:184 (+) Transcript_28506:1-552(+)